MAHFLLRYTVADDYLARRPALRAAHLEHARAAVARGELLLGGAMEDVRQGAMLLFETDDPAVAEAFARADPYVTNGIVTAWRVDRWLTVVGKQAAEIVPA